MDFISAMQVSGSALKAQRARINVDAENLANVNTTRTIEGGPYRAKSVVFAAKPVNNDFEQILNSTAKVEGVEVVDVVEDQTPFKEIFDPSHPDADDQGVVRLPNVNVVEQMVDMMGARRAYEANVTALDAVKSMALKALDISR